MLFEPPMTAWDLRWRMFGIPVRVHPLFWVVSLVLGNSALALGVAYLFAWVACIFASILIHELGHALMGRFFGSHGHIVLYSFGGLAIGSNQLRSHWQRVAVCLAGPAAGFLFLIALLILVTIRHPADLQAYLIVMAASLGIPLPRDLDPFGPLQLMVERRFEFIVVCDLIYINLFWGLVNLLPIWPLDGGQVTRELYVAADRRRGLVVSLRISLVAAVFLVAACLFELAHRPILPFRLGSPFLAVMFGLLAYQNYQELMRAQAESHWLDDRWNDPR